MTLEGTICRGAIVLDQPLQLPDGSRVEVTIRVPAAPTGEPRPTLLGLLKLAGTAQNLPEDFAAQHDHYIHGTPRR